MTICVLVSVIQIVIHYVKNVTLVAINVIMITIAQAMVVIIGVLVVTTGVLAVIVVKLVMENNVQILFNYLNNIAYYKFDNQCIYSNHYNMGDLQCKEQKPNINRNNHGKVRNIGKD